MNFHPTLEGRMPIGSFGTPKTFRVPQNTTCYVRLNINFQCLEITIQQSKFYLGQYWFYTQKAFVNEKFILILSFRAPKIGIKTF